MFISTIIPTIGRSTLSRAVHSVLDQGFQHDAYEVIVVNDSGKELVVEDWQKNANVKIVHTNQLNRSIARNTGAAIATGRYLHFLDDDDWMLPGAFEALLNVAKQTKAAWIYGAFRLVDNQGAIVAEIIPEVTGNCCIQMMAWEMLPLQASFILSDSFFAVDGFKSLSSLGGGFEDVHLSRQIALLYDMARVENVVTTIRIGDVGSTTNYVTMFDQNRLSREKVLTKDYAFSRMIASAKSSPSRSNYWFGKVIYYYLASLKWNLQNKRFFTAASRGTCLLNGFALAGRRLISSDFWRGVIRPHYPRMGIAIQEAGLDHLYANTRQAIDRKAKKSRY